jgi:hypothetical protein
MAGPGQVFAAVRWLAAAGGAAGPGELGAALGISHTPRAGLLAELRRAGLIEGSQKRIRLTAGGWAYAGEDGAEGAGPVLDVAGAGWPYAHRAFLELLCSQMIARHHLADSRTTGHLGFMAIGETGTGKTALGLLACHLFGLDAAAARRLLYTETAGSLLGRRESGPGPGWHLEPSEAAGLPLLLLDEFDKGDDAVRRVAWAFFQGQTAVRHEGLLWDIRPVPMLAANPPQTGDRYRLLRPEYRRRSVVLDTGYMRGRGHEIEDVLTGYYQAARPGALSLDRLTPPAARLDDRGRAVLRSVRHVLTEAGREEFPGTEAVELATLGRLALMGSDDHALAAFATTLAYLQVAATVPGQVIEGWQPDMRALRAQLGDGAAALAGAVDRGRAGRAAAIRHARGAVVGQEKLSDELTAARDELGERLRLAAASIEGRKLGGLDDDRKAKAAGVRGALSRIRRETMQCRSAGRLAELADRAAAPLEAAGHITAYLASQRARRDQDRNDAALQRQQDTAARSRDRDMRAAQAARQREQLTRASATARHLESLYRRTTTRPDEKPLTVLSALELVTYEARPQPERKSWRMLAASQPPGDWRVPGEPVSFPGWPGYCAALSRWGPGTRAVLMPWLLAWQTQENNLRTQLGRKPRQRLTSGPQPNRQLPPGRNVR